MQHSAMASLELQDVTHQLVQQFSAELEDMLDDLISGTLSELQRNVLTKIVAFFDQEMKEHHLEEDRHIFPILLARGDAQLVEKVQALKAEHEELRQGWQELRSWLEREGSDQMDGVALRASFQRYSDCFAGHLALEESLQFSSETKSLFQRWDS